MTRNRITIRRGFQRGQAMVEFALTAIVALLVLFLGIQFALLGQAALAVGQLAYQGARYASINPNVSDTDVATWMRGVASPTIASTDTKTLNISVSDASGSSPRPFQSTVTVTVTLDPVKKNLVLLPNPFFGVNFGGTISSTQNAMVD